MADPTSVAADGRFPSRSGDALARRELHARALRVPGEDLAEALAPGIAAPARARRRAGRARGGRQAPVDAVAARATRCCSASSALLSEDEPHLADGTLLNPHQVDALSGTLTALLAEAQRSGNGNGNGRRDARRRARDERRAAAPTAPTATPTTDEDASDEPRSSSTRSVARGRGAARLRRRRRGSTTPVDEAPEDPNAHKRFWFEHATGAGKTVAAMGFVEASRTGGILILTHRRNLVDQFNGELQHARLRATASCPAAAQGPGRRRTARSPSRPTSGSCATPGNISSAYTVVICDEAHTALGEKTAAAIREWTGPIFIGMTATGALIARHVTDLFPTQTSRFDLAQAARRGVIAPLRCVRIPPGPGVRTIAKVPLRRGEVDTEFDQEMLAELLDQLPFNLAAANLYKTRFNGMPGVVYAAGVRHAYNLAEAFREEGIKAEGVSGETPKRQLAEILAKYERGDIDVLINAQLLAEGWNSPRATVCFHLAPTASKRIYQQRVGRVTRRHPGKEAGIVVDFVHPGTKHDDPVVTLHSLLDRDVYRGGAIVVGPGAPRPRAPRARRAPRAAGRRRREPADRGLRARAVADRRRAPRLGRADPVGRARRRARRAVAAGAARGRCCTSTGPASSSARSCSPRSSATRTRSCACARCRRSPRRATPRRFDLALDEVGGWPRDEKREACKMMLQALAEKRIGRRDQADAWIWRIAGYTAELHEEYAVQRWPETKRLLGLLANSSRRRPRAQRAPARARRAQAGPPARRRAARRRDAVHAHARGRGGPARRAHPHGAQAVVAVARAAAQLPEGPPRPRPAPQEEGRRDRRRARSTRPRPSRPCRAPPRRSPPRARAAGPRPTTSSTTTTSSARTTTATSCPSASPRSRARGRRGRRGGPRAGRRGRRRPRGRGQAEAEAAAGAASRAVRAQGRSARRRDPVRRGRCPRRRRRAGGRGAEAQAPPLPPQARGRRRGGRGDGERAPVHGRRRRRDAPPAPHPPQDRRLGPGGRRRRRRAPRRGRRPPSPRRPSSSRPGRLRRGAEVDLAGVERDDARRRCGRAGGRASSTPSAVPAARRST